MDVTEPIFTQYEPDTPERVRVELAAEIKRLCAGTPSEIEELYRINPGPNTRRKALHKLSAPRIARNFPKAHVGLTAICEPNRITLELAVADRRDELPDAPCAQGYIPFKLYFDEPTDGTT